MASKSALPESMNVTKYVDFSVRIAGDTEDLEKVKMRGVRVLCFQDKVVIVDLYDNVFKLFDQDGGYLSSQRFNGDMMGLTGVNDSAFASCGDSNYVYLWTLDGENIVSKNESYHVEHKAHGIHYNGTYYCVLHQCNDAISILDRQGTKVRKIILKGRPGNQYDLGLDIHMDSDTNNIYVPCLRKDGVRCITEEGRELWFAELDSPCGITEIRGTLCVVGLTDNLPWLHLFAKNGDLQGMKDLGRHPRHVSYKQNKQNGRLFVTYKIFDDKGVLYDKISIYSIT